METPTATLTENQLRDLQASQAALARVAAEEKAEQAVPISTRAPAVKPSLIPNDWKLFDGQHVVHWPDSLSPAEMQQQTVQALSTYYSKANITKLFLKGKYQSFAIRLMGHNIVKKWKAQNKGYIKLLKQGRAINQTPGFIQGKP